jgi:FxsC-like protein
MVGAWLQTVAGSAGFTSELVFPTGDVAPIVRGAALSNGLVAVVVDPWTLRLEPYHRRLLALDAIPLPLHNTAVVVPWNDNDAETQQAQDVLILALQATLGNQMRAPDPKTFHVHVASPKDLEATVRDALIEIQKRIFERGNVQQKAQAAGVFVKPILSVDPT